MADLYRAVRCKTCGYATPFDLDNPPMKFNYLLNPGFAMICSNKECGTQARYSREAIETLAFERKITPIELDHLRREHFFFEPYEPAFQRSNAPLA